MTEKNNNSKKFHCLAPRNICCNNNWKFKFGFCKILYLRLFSSHYFFFIALVEISHHFYYKIFHHFYNKISHHFYDKVSYCFCNKKKLSSTLGYLIISSYVWLGKKSQRFYYKIFHHFYNKISYHSYLPTPLLVQDMTQGQFLSGV